MKQSTLKWLSCSLILLVAISCRKKEKGVLDDFDSGIFDFACIWNKNGVQDTATGEVSGPDASAATSYYFNVRQKLGGINSLKDFQVGDFKKMVGGPFYAPGLLISAKITYEEHDADHLLVHFLNDGTLPSGASPVSGTFQLTRKE
ncbi:hypothetical protein [Fluviicola sp.]|jgi:hypothetical protein|uniref:hypothetical protein n=1 Tax=Fluviicola sp. TaxID=1917219 RepID=UPI00282A4B83|nr:hypothetical protein [Fluviicola sp.]MDR0803229.1 hypothetical protein [Fluviicola sp.]